MTITAQTQEGMGSLIAIGTQGGSPTYTQIGGNTEIEPPQPKWGKEDVTTLPIGASGTTPPTLTGANFLRKFLKTLQDGGEPKLTGFWQSGDPGQIALYAAYNQPSNSTYGSVYPFKIILPVNLAGGQLTTGDTLTFSAHVMEFAMGKAEPGKPVPYSAALQVDGSVAPTYTEGS